MVPGNLVHPAGGGLHMYDSINPFGMYISEFQENQVGVVIDSCYSPSDVPYVRVIVNKSIGWVRYERVKVVR